MKDAIHTQGSGRGGAVVLAVLVCLVWAGSLLLSGCTSDPASLVGAGLVETRIDSTLLSLEVRQVSGFAGLPLVDRDRTLTEKQALYLGVEEGARASFLAEFDLTDRNTTLYPDSLFTAANIRRVKLGLTKFETYKAANFVELVTCLEDSIFCARDTVVCDTVGGVVTCDTFCVAWDTVCVDSMITIVPEPIEGRPQVFHYFVHELDAPIVQADFENYPATIPDYDQLPSNSDYFESDQSDEPELSLFPEDLLGRWFPDGQVGFLVQLGDQSDPGLTGYASLDLLSTNYNELADLKVGSVPAPNLIIEFVDGLVDQNPNDNVDQDFLLLAPSFDCTVWEEVPTLPEDAGSAADGFTLRTGLRSYPSLRFDTANLPVNARINRAILSVTNDPETSFGPAMSLQVVELDSAYAVPGLGSDVSVLRDEDLVYALDVATSKEPKIDTTIELDVTLFVQREVNRTNAQTRSLLLTCREYKDVFPTFSNPDPTYGDFYYRMWNFHGLADPDPDLRPFLKVWYTVDGEVTGGVR